MKLFRYVVLLSLICLAARADSVTGYAHICSSSGKLCQQEVPVRTVVCPVGMVCAGKTDTTTSTTTATGTGTFYQSVSQPVSATVTATSTNSSTLYGADGVRFITTDTTAKTVTGTGVGTGTGTNTGTGLGTFTRTATVTDTYTFSDTATYTSQNGTMTLTVSSTGTSTAVRTGTLVNSFGWIHSPTNTKTVTATAPATATATGYLNATVTTTGTGATTATADGTGTVSGTAVAIGTASATNTAIGGTSTVTATVTTTYITGATKTLTGTWNQSVTQAGTGTITVIGTSTAITTYTASGTQTITLAGTATGNAVLTGSGSATATAYDTGTWTATSYSTATSATVASNPTISYSEEAAGVPYPGGDLFMTAGFNSGNYIAFHTYPGGEVQLDPWAVPGVGSPVVLSTPCNQTGDHTWCSLVNLDTVSSSATWVTEGTVRMWVWAKTTSAAQVVVYFDTCTGGYPTGSISTIPTVTINVTSSSWTQFYVANPLPNGLLLPADYQFCTKFVAYTSSGTPTVTLGATYPHYTRINGPWIQSGANSL